MEGNSHLRPSDGGEPSFLIGRLLGWLQVGIFMVLRRLRQRLLQIFLVFFIVFLLLWIAAFLYGSFYFSYMPQAAFSTPVYFYHRTDCESPSSFSCSYPVANISLMRNNRHVLTFGQAYMISLQLDMPDSPINQELGMFMIRTTCFSRAGEQIASSARSAKELLSASSSRFSMLRYRSDLLRQLGTLLFLPAFLSGVSEQKQVLEVELFSEYIEDPYSPSYTAVIEILSNKVQIYSSELFIHAHFTGIRYLLFNFPLTSALVGVSSNFSFLSLLFVLSYLRLLLKADWRPEQLRTDRRTSERENTVNNNHQRRGDAAEGDSVVAYQENCRSQNQDFTEAQN